MAAAQISTTAHLGARSYFSSLFSISFSNSIPSRHPKKNTSVKCAVPASHNWRESRRSFSISLIVFNSVILPQRVIAGSIFDKYLKRKKLEPLESYVPAVILTQLQIKDLEKSLEIDQPQYAACRSLLRSGPAASFRTNIRAVAQYASDGGSGNTAFNDVDQCLRALEDLDSLLLRASRKDAGASVELMKSKISVAVNSLDSLLQTIPSDVLDKGKAIADAYRIPEEEVEPQDLDPELKQLESIL